MNKFVLTASFVLLTGLAPSAHASPVDPVHDSWQTTCGSLADDNLDGNADAWISVSAIASAIANYYNMPLFDADNVLNEQVRVYCPQYWPLVAASEQTARATGWM
jgi:hypothetical protein